MQLKRELVKEKLNQRKSSRTSHRTTDYWGEKET